MEIAQRYNYWLELAQYDIETAEAMLLTGRYLYVGFMCHQTIEKAIKAYHWKTQQTEPAYIHILDRLAHNCGLLPLLSREQQDLLDELNPLNIEARYPTYKEILLKELNREKCEDILLRTRELLAWIKKS